jgi:hypothetical protein
VSVSRVVPDFVAQESAAGSGFYAEVLGLEVVMDLGWIVTFAAPDNPAAQISVMRHDATASVQPDVSRDSRSRREVATPRCGRSSRRATVDALSRHALADLGHEWTGLRLEVFDDLITARKPA